MVSVGRKREHNHIGHSRGHHSSKLEIERTQSFQIENEHGGYVATVYSQHDADIVKKLAQQIDNPAALSEHSSEVQPRGRYVYKKIDGKEYPIAESYDSRLDALIKANLHKLKGD